MKKFNKFADFIIECLVEEYTKLEFNNYKLKEEYHVILIQLYQKYYTKLKVILVN